MKESMDIRNKRILQLEDQIGYASEFAATRDSVRETPTSTPNPSLLASLDRIESKLSTILSLQSPLSNSIVINTHHPDTPTHTIRSFNATHTQTQTDIPSNVANDDLVTDMDNTADIHTDTAAPVTLPPTL